NVGPRNNAGAMKRPAREDTDMQRVLVVVSRFALAAACVWLVSAGYANAADYPARQPHIIVGYPAGGSTDICARLFVDWLSKRLGSSSLSRTAQEPATISRPKRSPSRRPMATRSFW